MIGEQFAHMLINIPFRDTQTTDPDTCKLLEYDLFHVRVKKKKREFKMAGWSF